MNWSREKRKRQQVATLLIEPTAEQEEETNRRADERVLSAMWQKSIIISDNDDINKLKRSKSAFSHSIAQNSNDHQNLKKNVIMSGNNNVSEDNYHGSSGISEKSNFRPSTNSKSKSQLTSMLVILFGPLLIIYLLNNCASCAQQMSQLNSQSNLLNLTTAPQSSLNEMVPSGQASSMSLMNTSNVKPLVLRNRSSGSGGESLTSASTITTTPLTVTSTVATGGAGGGDDDDSSDTPVEDVDVSEEEATSSTSETSNGDQSTGKLANVILGAASDGADLLVKKLKPPVDSNDSIDDSPVPGDDIDPESENSPKSGGKADVNEMDAKKEESMIRAAKQVAGEIIKDINGKLSQVNRTARHQAEMEAELKLAMETYAKWRQVGDDVIELFSRKLLPVIIEHGYDVDAGTVSGLLQVFNGIRGLKPWAMKLLDASAKIAPGILVGTQSDFGDYDECINIRADDPSGLVAGNPELMGELDPETGLYSSTLVGKYCLADIEFPKPPRQRLSQRNEELQTDFAPIELRRPLLNFSETAAFKETIFVETGNFFHMLYVDPLRVGICLTNKIDADNFAIVFNKLIAEFKVKIDFKGRCVTKYDKQHWTVQQVVSAYVISIACFLVCLCTLLDLLHMKLNKLPLPRSLKGWKCKFRITLFKYRPLFTSFSIIRNTKRLFKPQQQDSATRNKISSLQGSMSNKLLLHSSDHSKAASGTGLSTSASSTSSVSTASMAPDSSVESSPCIERRSSSVTGSAIRLIQGNGSDSASMVTSNASLANVALSHGGAKYLNSYSRANALAEQQPVDSLMQKQSQQPVSLMCLHGIRVITMTWMIVNHTYLFGGFFVLWAHRRLIDIAEWPKSVSFQMVLNGWLTVETYFFLSATIIVLNLMPLMKKRKFSYLSYIFHRLLRLLPAYIGLICLNFLWPLVSSGPVWLVKGKSFIQTPCENYLWTNFLFINNWIWPEKQCMVHTWFLSADFQLYLLAPLIVYFLYRRPVFGHSLNLLVAIVASVVSGLVIYANKLMPTTLINKLEFDSIKQQLSYSYFATYQHMGPYCLGILTGYMLHKCPQVRLPKHLTWSLWILLPPLSFTTLLLTYLWNGAYDDPAMINPSPVVSALYIAIHRTIWTSLVAWIVFACATGRAKMLSNFLSHSMFVPLSRLSFSIYLVHLPVIMFRALNLRHTIEWTDANILWEASGNFIISIVVGYFVNITFESPIINLEQVIFGRPNTTSLSDSSNESKYKSNLLSGSTSRQVGEVVSNKQMASLARQVTSNLVSLDSDNKSDTNRSSSSVDQMPNGSSPEQEQDLVASATTKATATAITGIRSDSNNDIRAPDSLSLWPPMQTNNHQQVVMNQYNMNQLQRDQQQQVLRNQDQRRSLRPMRGTSTDHSFSFGNQMELPDSIGWNSTKNRLPSSSEVNLENCNNRREASSELGLVSSGNQQVAAGSVPFNRRFLSSQEQAALNADFKHYGRGGYQRWRMSSRPMQYATMVPSGGASGSGSRSSGNRNRLLANRHMEMDYYDRYNSNCYASELDFTTNCRRPKASSSLLSEPTRGAVSMASYDTSGDQQSIGAKSLLADARQQIFSIQQQHQQQPSSQAELLMQARRRSVRYNTLTGIGSREWRGQMRAAREDEQQERAHEDYLSQRNGQQILDVDQASWRRLELSSRLTGEDIVPLNTSPSSSSSSSSPSSSNLGVLSEGASNWLNQTGGVLIPRIDSSTLRRNLKRNEPQAANSIIEEPNSLDDNRAEERGGEEKNQEEEPRDANEASAL